MNRLEGVLASLDYLLGNKRKRHIIGGVLMSTSLLFVGLAFTVLSLKTEREKEYQNDDEQYIE